MIFVPSRRRRGALKRFFDLGRPRLAGIVLTDDDDTTYDDFELPEKWSFERAPRGSLVEIINRAWENHPNEAFYAVVGDDMIGEPAGWDETLAAAATPDRLAWGDDGRWGAELCAAFFVGGDLTRKVGFLAPRCFGHLYTDRVWWDIAQATGRADYRPGVSMKHDIVRDATYAERKIRGDAGTYQRIVADGTLQRWIELAGST